MNDTPETPKRAFQALPLDDQRKIVRGLPAHIRDIDKMLSSDLWNAVLHHYRDHLHLPEAHLQIMKMITGKPSSAELKNTIIRETEACNQRVRLALRGIPPAIVRIISTDAGCHTLHREWAQGTSSLTQLLFRIILWLYRTRKYWMDRSAHFERIAPRIHTLPNKGGAYVWQCPIDLIPREPYPAADIPPPTDTDLQ